jgi:hypothetical protein
VKRALWLLSCLCVACAGTETGNPSFAGSLGYDAYSSAPSVALQSVALSGTTQDVTEVQSAWLVLGDVSFLADGPCITYGAINAPVPGLGAGDHVSSQAPPTSFELESGRYCGARVPLFASEETSGDTPPDLSGHSLMLSGKLGDGRSFELRSTRQAPLVLRATRAFELDQRASGVLIGFDVAHWLEDLPWGDAESDDAGVIAIDEGHNAELLRGFEHKLPGGVSLFRDLDGDGLLDEHPTLLATGAE